MNKKGFTLVEAVIYIAIVSILLVSLTDFHFTLGGTASKLSENIDVSRNRRIALTNIDYLIRNADGLLKDVNGDCSDFTSSPQKLSLYFEADTYLPGTCVSSGGGVNITVSSERVYLECLPNITYNGEYEACDTSASNTYYLTSPTVKVNNSDLSFATSTVNGFDNIATTLTVNSKLSEPVHLTASSAATSTISLRNQQDNGLIAWWKMDDAAPITAITDTIGNHDHSCSGSVSSAAAVIDGSTNSFSFGSSSDYCQITDTDDLNFTDSFTLTAWVDRDSNSTDRKEIVNKYHSSDGIGYSMYINNNELRCIICNGDTCSSFLLALDYHTDKADFVSCVYDKNAGKVINHVYQEGDTMPGSKLETSSSAILVNTSNNLFIGSESATGAYYFPGDIDEVRIYNRALTDNEIYALQSQGDHWSCAPTC